MTDPELLQAVLWPAVCHERDPETNHVVLLRPRFRAAWARRLLARPGKRHVRVHLDAMGTWVWDRLGPGVRLITVAQAMAEAFPEEPHPEARVLLFARQLLGSHLASLDPGATDAPPP